MKQEEMKVYKEYKVIGKGGKIFIIMRDSDNNLYQLTRTGNTDKTFKPRKSLVNSHEMLEPTKEDYNLFFKS